MAIRTLHLVIRPPLPTSLQGAPAFIHAGQRLRVRVRSAPGARVTVVLTVDGAASISGRRGPEVLCR